MMVDPGVGAVVLISSVEVARRRPTPPDRDSGADPQDGLGELGSATAGSVSFISPCGQRSYGIGMARSGAASVAVRRGSANSLGSTS